MNNCNFTSSNFTSSNCWSNPSGDGCSLCIGVYAGGSLILLVLCIVIITAIVCCCLYRRRRSIRSVSNSLNSFSLLYRMRYTQLPSGSVVTTFNPATRRDQNRAQSISDAVAEEGLYEAMRRQREERESSRRGTERTHLFY